jgi:undecaprenyl diphosphate synthase
MLVRQFAYRIYEMSLSREVKQSPVPRCIALVISDSDLIDRDSLNKLLLLMEWCAELKITEASVYVTVTAPEAVSKLAGCISGIFKDAGFPARVVTQGTLTDIKGDLPCAVNVSIGYGGKHELTNAIREVMKDVQNDRVQAENIDEQTIESHLIFKCEPDLFIRTGEARLTDFLIWQAVYSELYFTDVNWEQFRKIDLLRAVRDYQYRQRRYGS